MQVPIFGFLIGRYLKERTFEMTALTRTVLQVADYGKMFLAFLRTEN